MELILRLSEWLDRQTRRDLYLTERWQGVDLSVAGSYPELVQYLAELETTLPGLRWGPLQIATPTMPPVLSVRLLLVAEGS